VDAFTRAVERHIGAPHLARSHEADFQVEGGFKAAVDILAGRPRPTAVLAANDWMARPVPQEAPTPTCDRRHPPPSERRNTKMPPLTRRDLLRLAAASPVLALRPRAGRAAGSLALDLASFARAPGRVVTDPGGAAVRLDRDWEGALCRARIVNEGRRPARVREVVLFDVRHGLPPETGLYGEGFQMLSQTGGTLGAPTDLGNYTDAKHYKMAQPEGARVVHGLLTLSPPSADASMIAFTSCRRFDGLFRLRPSSLEVVVDTEGLELGPGEAWDLEELTFRSGAGREALLEALAQRLARNHPPLPFPAPPSGWCSWYCFGPGVTAQQVLANLDVIAAKVPGLKYIQIDDGYQPAMGDWLDTGPAFGGDVRGVLAAIRARGFEPAIWVAPFIAEAGSKLFRQHPGWFVKDPEGAPLRSDRVTFGGWRRGPWYALDGTHPEAQAHLESVFRTMRTEWGVTYFKLDANFWGAIHGGRFHDPRATRIEAYRRGMQAVLRGSGEAFVLGCNHPIWGSLGLVHGSRSSNDIKRDWSRFTTIARQNLGRNWQNGRLWWNDPDAVVLTGTLGEEEFRFHATSIYASGGMILSGDDLTTISPERLEMLRKLQPPTGRAARFADESFRVGVMDLAGRRAVCLLNWDDAPRTLSFPLPGPHRVRELWTGEDRGRHEAGPVSIDLPGRSGRVLLCTPAFDVAAFDRERVLSAAERYLGERPATITASPSPRSAGSLHEFHSEADYWWPDPANPGGPYIQRDGMTNPDNFVLHRRHMVRLSVQVPALAAAWTLTRDARYATHAARHLRAWFVDEATRMEPHLKYAQSIHGRVTGRGIGIIDTIHLVEVARAAEVLKDSGALTAGDREAIRRWFADYLVFMTTHPYGIAERDTTNNHATCWAMQVAAFARLTGDEEKAAFCRRRFKDVLVGEHMAADGSFPREMGRTKPYGYALFNLEALATVAQILSTPGDDLWTFETPDGRGLRRAVAFMYPYIRDQKAWPLPPDVMYHDEWPMRQASLLFAGLALDEPEYVALWKTLPADSEVEEVVRNFFVRQPVLWVER